jgi:transglutaminase-like putative cysteine protease
MYKEKKVKAGDKLVYYAYEPSLTTVITVRSVVKPAEEVDVIETTKAAPAKPVLARRKLLRVEAKPDKIEVPGVQVPQLPTMVSWLDRDLLPVRSQVELPFGKVTLYRTTRAVATGPNGRPADIGLESLVKLNRAIPNAYKTRSVVYRITLKGDENPKTAFAQDDRQTVKNVKADTFELHVRALREPTEKEDAGKPKEEFTKSCYFLDSDDKLVKKYAAEAVGEEEDPWKKAQAVEKWVYKNIAKKNYTVAFTTAGQVAKNLEGDCRHHAVLTAAMCRAAGVPSRTAVGLIYVHDRSRGPVMGFHMWTEVWVKGQWLAIDATLGQGSVGAAHVKIADSSWHDVQSLTPMLPVARVLGKVAIQVVSVDELE